MRYRAGGKAVSPFLFGWLLLPDTEITDKNHGFGIWL